MQTVGIARNKISFIFCSYFYLKFEITLEAKLSNSFEHKVILKTQPREKETIKRLIHKLNKITVILRYRHA